MMRRTLHIALTLLLILSAGSLSAQRRLTADNDHHKNSVGHSSRAFTTRDAQAATDRKGLRQSLYVGDHHSFGLALTGAYSTFLSSSSGVSSRPGGYAMGFDLLYEYQHQYLLFQVGLGVAWQDVRLNVDNLRFTNTDRVRDWGASWATIVDSWGAPLKSLNYSFTRRSERLRNGYIHIPLLVGGTYAGFYGLAGAKLNIAFIGSSKVKATCTTTGTYDRYIGTGNNNEWEEMDNHGYRKNVDLAQSGSRVPFKMDIMLSAEVGYEWVMKETWRLRLAAYADYGLVNINPKGNDYAAFVPAATKFDFATYQLHPSFGSRETSSAGVHNLFVGLKFTILYTLYQPDKCILCSHTRRSKHWH